MGFKGFNTILFDFDSLIDIELSVIQWLRGEYGGRKLNGISDYIFTGSMEEFKFKRIHGTQDLFGSMLDNMDHKDVIKAFRSEYEKDILRYAYPTNMQSLIRAYSKAGNGVIKTAVRCSNETQKKYVESLPTDIELCSRHEVNMSRYGRLVVGDAYDALLYRLEEPKSILVLNYRDNFTENDITLLRPELIISLGDIHDIQVISAYADDEEEMNG